jgi:hypothetical protein
MKKILAASIALILSKSLFAVGPWVNAKGSMFTQFSYSFMRYNQVFDGYKKVVYTSDYVTDMAFRNYTEYSITNRTLLSAILPIRYVGFEGKHLVGLGDIRLGGKTELFPDNSPVSVYYTLFLPTGRHKSELRTDYKVFGAELGLATGFAVSKYYAQLSAGYRYRNGITDQAIFELELARLFMVKERKLYIAFNFDGALNTDEQNQFSAADSKPIGTQLYNYNAAYVSPGFKFLYNVKSDWWLTATVKGGLAAQNIAAFPGLDVGLAYKIEK